MLSDDTEHSLMIAKALIQHPNDLSCFSSQLARDFRWWLLALPAGVGLATARAIAKLWFGFPPSSSGVYSAGNGAAMRVAIIGVYFFDSPNQLERFVRAATVITHTDSRALTGALAIARLAAWVAAHTHGQRPHSKELGEILRACGHDPEWIQIVKTVEQAAKVNLTVDELAHALQISERVSGYVYHSVPIAIYSFWRHAGNFRAGTESTIRCGGDTDTTAAITGSLLGAGCPLESIPIEWRDRLCDWPRSSRYIRKLVKSASQTSSAQQESLFLT